MKHRSTALLCLLAVLLLCLPCTGYAETAAERVLHPFLSLSFDTATADDVEQALLANYGVGWDPGSTNHVHSGITAFGYEFALSVWFRANQEIGFDRVILSPADRSIWGKGTEEFMAMLRRDIADFIALDGQICQEYGEPDWRFFRVNGEEYNPSKHNATEYMFADGLWNAEQMLSLCEKQKSLRAFTAWGNVVLDYWVYWDQRPNRNAKSSITLYYYNFVNDWDPSTIAGFPPAAD